MRSTNELETLCDMYQKEDVIIHPNEGYDLGLMQTTNQVKIFSNISVESIDDLEDDFIFGIVFLSNSCRHGKICFNNKFWKKLGMPKKVKLFYDEDKLLVTNC